MKIGIYDVKRVKEKDKEYILFEDFNIFCEIHKTHLTGFKEDDVEIISIPNLIKFKKSRTKNSVPIYYTFIERAYTAFSPIYNGIKAYDFKDECADAISLFEIGVIDFFYYNEYNYESAKLNSFIEITAAFKCITIDEEYRKFNKSKFARFQSLVAEWKSKDYIRYYLGFYATDYLGIKYPYYFYDRNRSLHITSDNISRFFTDNNYFLSYKNNTREEVFRKFRTHVFDDMNINSYYGRNTNIISERKCTPMIFSKIIIPYENDINIDFRKISSSEFEENSTIVNIPII